MDAENTENFTFDDLSWEIDRLARFLGMSKTALKKELLLVGWGVVMRVAERRHRLGKLGKLHLARPDPALPNIQLLPGAGVPFHHVQDAARLELPYANASPSIREARKREELGGYLYVLHDGMTGMSKIGCTRENGPRQRAIMGGHGSVLANVMNVKVPDRRAAEAQCHAQFEWRRRNGEWFSVRLGDIIEFIRTEVPWLEIHFEERLGLRAYRAACREGNMQKAKGYLKGPRIEPDCVRALPYAENP